MKSNQFLNKSLSELNNKEKISFLGCLIILPIIVGVMFCIMILVLKITLSFYDYIFFK